MTVFGENLKRILLEKDLTNTKFASQIGYSKSTISNWISGKSSPSIDDVLRICRLLGLSADHILGLRPKEHEFKGIRWIEESDYIQDDAQRKEIEIGISLFRALVVKGHDINHLLKDPQFRAYDWKTLLSTFKVAARSGAFRLTNVPRDLNKEQELQQRYPELLNAIVYPVTHENTETLIEAEMVAFLAATEALPTLKGKEIIGLGAGYTLLRFAEISIPTVAHFSGTKWIPLVSSEARNLGTYSANFIAHLMASRHPKSDALYLPYVNSHSSNESKQQAQEISKALRTANAVFTTVNGPGRMHRIRGSAATVNQFWTADDYSEGNMSGLYSTIVNKGLGNELKGEFLGLMLGYNAEPLLIEECKKSFYQVDLSMIHDIVSTGLVWIVAAGTYKAEPTHMILRNGLANALVIDSTIADYLIQNS